MARIIGDVEVMGVGVREFTIETWDTILLSLSLRVTILVFDPDLTILALLPVAAAMLLAKAAGRWVAGRTTASREANGSLTTAFQEQLSGIRVLRLFGRSSVAVRKVDELSGTYADANLSLVNLSSGLRPVYTTIMTAGVLLVVWQSGHNVFSGAMTLGAFVAYLELYLRFVNRGFRVPQMINSIQAGTSAYSRIKSLLAQPPPLRYEPPRASFHAGHMAGINEPGPQRPGVTSGPVAVSVQGVTFSYLAGSDPALRDISLNITAGSLVAITGPVGSGKSAIAKALLELYPLESGQVLLDGIPLEDIPAAARVGYLGQDLHLFSGTLRGNILLGSVSFNGKGTGTDTVLNSAISCAVLEEDLQALHAGLETEIGELGIRVSSGQRERIALSGAMAASAPSTPGSLILDDPFSAVDIDAESKIIAGLRNLFGPSAPSQQRCAIVLFSHRLSAFPQEDQVVVLENWSILEQRTHEELSETGGLYSRIYQVSRRMESPWVSYGPS